MSAVVTMIMGALVGGTSHEAPRRRARIQPRPVRCTGLSGVGLSAGQLHTPIAPGPMRVGVNQYERAEK